MKKVLSCLLPIILIVSSCATKKNTVVADNTVSITNDGKAWAALWQQRSAEYKALCFQAYNIAKLRVDESLQHTGAKPFAIVTDIDETVLDNSPYDAKQALLNKDYNDATWKEWTDKAIADTVPGAPAFLKYAAAKGITIFYITNRSEAERASTLKNLNLYNLPNADDAHLLLKQSASSKETRRNDVLKTHQVLLLCGDNLPDFDILYDEHPSEESRSSTTQKLRNEFGSKYIIIPNSSYGDFEGALFKFNYKQSNAQKDSIIKSKLKTY